MNIQFKLEDTPAIRLEKLRRLAEQMSLPRTNTASGIPRTPTERSENITVVRDWYPPGYLPRYTLDDGSGSTAVTAAWDAMLRSGAGLCIVPRPVTAWLIDDLITWQPGVAVLGARGNIIWSDVASGDDTFLFDGISYNDGAGFFGFAGRTLNDGANFIQVHECGNVHFDDFSIKHLDTGLGGVAIYFDGDAAGNHHNAIGHNGFIIDYATGMKLFTSDGGVADCNRNRIGQIHINNCTVGLDIDKSSTNHIECSLQGNDTGAVIGAGADKNIFDLMGENNTIEIVMDASATNNVFRGNTDITHFTTAPHHTTIVLSSNSMLLPRDINMPSTGSIRLMSPNDAGPMRWGPWQAGQSLRFTQRNNAGGNEDVAALGYHATDPYFELFRPLRLMSYTVATLPAGTAGDTAFVTDATAPAFGAAVVGGGAVKVPVYYTGVAWFVG